MLPALVLVEEAKSADGGSTSRDENGKSVALPPAPPLRQLGDYQFLREVGRGGDVPPVGRLRPGGQGLGGRHLEGNPDAARISWQCLRPAVLQRREDPGRGQFRSHAAVLG